MTLGSAQFVFEAADFSIPVFPKLKLRGNAARIFGLIVGLSKNNSSCNARNKYISRVLNITVRTVQANIKKLKDLNIIQYQYDEKERNNDKRKLIPNWEILNNKQGRGEENNMTSHEESDVPVMKKTTQHDINTIQTNKKRKRDKEYFLSKNDVKELFENEVGTHSEISKMVIKFINKHLQQTKQVDQYKYFNKWQGIAKNFIISWLENDKNTHKDIEIPMSQNLLHRYLHEPIINKIKSYQNKSGYFKVNNDEFKLLDCDMFEDINTATFISISGLIEHCNKNNYKLKYIEPSNGEVDILL